VETAFALHGRLRPYNKYLPWELENFRARTTGTALSCRGRVLEPELGPFAPAGALARRHGHADVLERLGTDIELIHSHADKALPQPPEVTAAAREAH
jgi:hypothetical protein